MSDIFFPGTKEYQDWLASLGKEEYASLVMSWHLGCDVKYLGTKRDQQGVERDMYQYTWKPKKQVG